jgi:protein-disulfide isomerase
MKAINIAILILVLLTLGLNAWIVKDLYNVKNDLRDQRNQIATALGEIKKIQSPKAVAPAQPEQPSEVRVSIENAPMKGDPKAPVTIVEFSDYQCPFCRRFHQQTLPQIEEEYINKGKVRYVFRDYPLDFHKLAVPAAHAANCAGEQGKYWEFNDFLFENPDKLDTANTLSFAKGVEGLDYEQFEKCVNEKKFEAKINKDLEDGRKYGVKGTPSFFVGKTEDGNELVGFYIRGSMPFQVFKAQIDKLLEENKS